ncbi:hypothetical protein LTR84_010288 [Exophiala bonariae]|uniref:Carboxylic ester hydrolase n=1 Tax=Exophiala bonariae TaxID=1690606 RepID=A0AAV9MU15_9EURO|nr:hypothetical protein LTR84_010288 [Exophiala bonariae]
MGSIDGIGLGSLWSFQHPTLGELTGVRRKGDIVQFRGIPFAEIPARFRQSVMRTTLPKLPYDATQPGSTCPHTQALPFPEFWTGPLPQDGIVLKQPLADEFNCLNLNITAPLTAVQDGHKVPVLVFIHGGAFMVGSSSLQVAGREIYDGVRLVQSSVGLGQPLVVVTINYRVGPLGFLASSALEAYNKSFGEAVGNYGLHDQRQALKWVYKFIDGFGGDPEMITIQGGSAGGASCHFQAQFREAKVKRAILSSGSTLAIGAMPLSYHEKQFEAFALRYSSKESGSIIEDLQLIPVAALVEETMAGFYNPVIDNDWIRGRTVTDLVENPTTVELMVGSCAFEQDLTLAMLGALDPNNLSDQAMRDTMTSMLKPIGLTSETNDLFSADVLKAYGIQNTIETPSKDRETWAEFVADMIFRIPPYLIGLKTQGKTFLYEFQSTNPYPGWKLGYGKANHAISDLFLFNPAGDLVEKKHQGEYSGAVQQLQRDWISFCYGQLDWEPFKAGDVDKLGPVYTFANHGAGGKFDTLEAAIGKDIVDRWTTVLKVAQT